MDGEDLASTGQHANNGDAAKESLATQGAGHEMICRNSFRSITFDDAGLEGERPSASPVCTGCVCARVRACVRACATYSAGRSATPRHCCGGPNEGLLLLTYSLFFSFYEGSIVATLQAWFLGQHCQNGCVLIKEKTYCCRQWQPSWNASACSHGHRAAALRLRARLTGLRLNNLPCVPRTTL